MDDKVKELLLKMKELGISESELVKEMSVIGEEIEGNPASKEEFEKSILNVRAEIKAAASEIFIEADELDKDVFSNVIGFSIFKASFRELANTESIRLVKFHDDLNQKIQRATNKNEAKEIFLNVMVAYEDVIYGNIGLFKDVDYNTVLKFTDRIGVSKSAAYRLVLETVNVCDFVALKNDDDIEKSKGELLEALSRILKEDIISCITDKDIKELVRLSSLKNIEILGSENSNDVFVEFAVMVAMLVLYGLIKKRTIFKFALTEVEYEAEK